MPDSNVRTLGDVATLVRAKNAGPFWMTLDVFLPDAETYQEVTSSGVISAKIIAGLYGAREPEIRIFNLDQLRIIKISFPRPTVQGSFADRDIHAGQQNTPLAQLRLQ